MKNLKNLLNQPLQAVPNSLVIFVGIIAFIGFLDSTYLTIEHFQGVIPPCSIIEGCDTVLTSVYSSILGIPVALLGSLYYLLILLGVAGYFESKKTIFFKWALLLSFIGIICSIWFVVLQLFILKSICIYCMLSAITSTILFITTMITLRKYKITDTWQNNPTSL